MVFTLLHVHGFLWFVSNSGYSTIIQSSFIGKYNTKIKFKVFILSFCIAKERVYNTIPVLYSKKKFDVGLDKTVFWLGNVVSFMSVVVCENLKTYNYWNAIVWIVPIYILHYIFYEFVVNTHKTLYKCEHIFEFYLINRMTINSPNLSNQVERSIVVLGPSISASNVVSSDALLRIPKIGKR